MNNDKIEIYKDQKLLNLTQKFTELRSEEVEFFLFNVEITRNGRTREDIARDMISVYETTNEYLRTHYPDNSVAVTWIVTNQFSANLLKERLQDNDSKISTSS